MKVLMYIIAAVIGYLLGNFSTGLIIGRCFGKIDIREHGSGNAGTTNVLRTLGWFPSILTLVGDALKAVLASLIGKWLGGEIGMIVGGLFCIIGHNWPVFFHFRGGKGIASTLGMVIVCHHWWALALFLPWLAIVALTRYVSVASIAMSFIYPVITAVVFWNHPYGAAHIIAICVMAVSAVFSHRANISRLIHGNENRLDFAKISKLSKKNK